MGSANASAATHRFALVQLRGCCDGRHSNFAMMDINFAASVLLARMASFINAVLIVVLAGLLAIAFGVVFGRLHPLIDLFGQFLLPAIVAAAALALVALLLGRYPIAPAARARGLRSCPATWASQSITFWRRPNSSWSRAD